MAPAKATTLNESPWDQAMAQIGQQRWNYYKKNLVPVENEYMGNVKWYNTPQAANEASTLATSDVYKQGTEANQQLNNSMALAGINPSSGSSIMKRAQMASGLADAAGGADVKARMGTKDTYLQGLENIVSMGNNQEGTAQNTLANVAGNALSQSEANAEYNQAATMAPASAAGTAVGLGLSGLNRRSLSSGG